MKKSNQGFSVKKGQLVKVREGIFEVEEDNRWEPDFQVWGSVRLKGLYPPRFTHKGGVEIYEKKEE